MAITTYDELKTAVARWLHRSDLTDQIPDFITLAESRLNRLLDLRLEETETSLTLAVNTSSVVLPSDYSYPIALWLETFIPRRKLVQKVPETIPYVAVKSFPTYWAIKGNTIQFDRIGLDNYPLTFRYARKFELSDASPTNYLLTNYPDAYLYGVLLESAPYIRDDARVALWQNRFDILIKEIQEQEDKSFKDSPLAVDTAVRSRYAQYNILEG